MQGTSGLVWFRRDLRGDHHVLVHHPANAHAELQERYRGRNRWCSASAAA